MNIVERAIKAREEQVKQEEEKAAAEAERQKQEDIKRDSENLVSRAKHILGMELDPATFEPVRVHERRWTVQVEIDGRIFRPYDVNAYHLEVFVYENMRPGYGDGEFKNFASFAELGFLFQKEAEFIERKKQAGEACQLCGRPCPKDQLQEGADVKMCAECYAGWARAGGDLG